MKHKWIAAGTLGLAALAWAAEILTVESSGVPIRAVPDIYARAIEIAPKNASLTVLEKQEKFARVTYGDKQGWVRLSDLKPRRDVSANAAAAGGTAMAGAAEDSAAGKGLGSNAEKYAKSKGGDAREIDVLIARRNELIDTGAVAKFAAEGHVGKNRGGN